MELQAELTYKIFFVWLFYVCLVFFGCGFFWLVG